jgi:hypothetical protein
MDHSLSSLQSLSDEDREQLKDSDARPLPNPIHRDDGSRSSSRPGSAPSRRVAKEMTRFYPGNAHVEGLSIEEAYWGSGELDGGR